MNRPSKFCQLQEPLRSPQCGARIFQTDGVLIDEQRALGAALKALAHAAKDVPAEQFVWAVLTPVAAVCSVLLAPEHDEHLVADFSQTLAAVRLLQRQTEGDGDGANKQQ
jgi:phosphoglycolate phosphatase-like HAD superfamily hydrolase